MGNSSDPASLRRTVYALLITLAVGAGAGRILAAAFLFDPKLFRDEANPNDKHKPWPKARPAPSPTGSSNDRSRWATVRALVDDGTFTIGRRAPGAATGVNPFGDGGIVFEDGWTSVDKVLHPETQEFYSSKPPLLSVLVAGEYWLLKHGLGWSFATTPECIVRSILMSINLLPFALYLIVFSRLAEKFGRTDWSRLYVVAAAALGTLVLPFLSTFNNHTPATFCALFAVAGVIEIWTTPERNRPAWFLLAGLLAGFTATLELPAAALTAALALILAWRWPKNTLVYFLPAAAIPVAALAWTNYLAVGQVVPVYSKLETPWYQYEGSHWLIKPGETKTGIDFLQESKYWYAFNLLLGHHGLFALTPVFLLSVAGLGMGLRRAGSKVAAPSSDPATAGSGESTPMPWFLYPLTAFLLLLLLGFYVVKTNNYGGGTCGPRWLMWLTPLLLLAALPAGDWLADRRWGRWLAYVCLGVSVVSAVYPMQNPWRHPWLYQFMESQGWLAS